MNTVINDLLSAARNGSGPHAGSRDGIAESAASPAIKPALRQERTAIIDAHNAAIDRELDQIRQHQESVILPLRNSLVDLAAELDAAHVTAAAAVAEAGGLYDPTRPQDASCVLRHQPVPLPALAARLGLPMVHADEHMHLPEVLSWFLTTLVGFGIGISLGILAHVLSADSLGRQAPLTIIFALLGFAVATAGKYGIRYAWYVASRDYFIPASPMKAGSMITIAVALSLLLFISDLVVERGGLLVIQTLLHGTAGLSGGKVADNPWEGAAYWFAAAIFTLGYIICAGYEGAIRGQDRAVGNRLLLEQVNSYKEDDTSIRSAPKVQAALLALALVMNIRRRQSVVQQRIEDLEAPFNARIAALEAQRLAKEHSGAFGGPPPARI